MRTRSMAVLAAAGLASNCWGVVNTKIDLQVSLDGWAWTSGSFYPYAGQKVYVRALVSYTGTAQPLGLASLQFQPVISNWSVLNAVQLSPQDDPSFGRPSPWNRVLLTGPNAIMGHVHQEGSGGAPAGTWLRIAQARATSWIGGAGNTTGGAGIPISQLNDNGRIATDPPFCFALQNIEVFRFAFVMGTPQPLAGNITIDAPLEGIGNRNSITGEREVYWFGSMTEGAGSIRGTVQVSPVVLHIPAPSGLCFLLGATGLAVRRKR